MNAPNWLRSRWRPWALLCSVLLLACPTKGGLPHVNDCNFCFHCLSDEADLADPTPFSTGSKQGVAATKTEASKYSIYPALQDIKAKALKPNCTSCYGCTTQLHVLKAVTAFGRDFSVELGASPEWIFTAANPAAGAGASVVKVWCMPLDKKGKNSSLVWRCKKSKFAETANQLLVAQDKVVHECGLQDITVKTWVAPVNAVEPGSGLHIWWQGLWMARAPGISLNQLSYVTRKAFLKQTILDLMQTKLNHTRVVHAALLDLLTSQCDRHSQNVFIDDRGQITLIDNLQALRFNWVHCGTDSIFLPGTQKNEVVRFGGRMVGKGLAAKMKGSLNPMILLDYRCYVPEGKIGTNYPPQLQKCLTKLSALTPSEIMEEYGFPLLRNAEVLHSRARDMLELGFEWTLQRGEPTNPNPRRYKWHQPCCQLRVDNGLLKCNHEWNVTAEFPKGDPIRGRDWKLPYPDPGTFEGGTQWE